MMAVKMKKNLKAIDMSIDKIENVIVVLSKSDKATKEVMFPNLSKLSEIKELDFIVIGDASIVCHGLKRNCDNISIICNSDINIDDIDIVSLNVDNYDLIDNYKFMTLEDCLKLKVEEDNPENRAIIKIYVFLYTCRLRMCRRIDLCRMKYKKI